MEDKNILLINNTLEEVVSGMVKAIDKVDFKSLSEEEQLEKALYETAGYIKLDGSLFLVKYKDGKLIKVAVTEVLDLNSTIENYKELMMSTLSKESSITTNNDEINKDLLEFVKSQMPSSLQEEATIEDIIKYAREFK